MNAVLTAKAWFELLYIDLVQLRGFRAVHRAVQRTRTRPSSPSPSAVPDVVEAVTRACFWYFKAPKCLQRSVAVTRLLRRQGVPAEMVVGCHLMPMRAHAWVEVAGDIVSDHLEGLHDYHVLDRV